MQSTCQAAKRAFASCATEELAKIERVRRALWKLASCRGILDAAPGALTRVNGRVMGGSGRVGAEERWHRATKPFVETSFQPTKTKKIFQSLWQN